MLRMNERRERSFKTPLTFESPLPPLPPLPSETLSLYMKSSKLPIKKRKNQTEFLLKRIEQLVRQDVKQKKKKKLYQPRSPLPRHQEKYVEQDDDDDYDDGDSEPEGDACEDVDVIRETYNENMNTPIVRVNRDANNNTRVIGSAKIVVRKIPVSSDGYIDDGWGDYRRRSAYKPFKKRRKVVFIS